MYGQLLRQMRADAGMSQAELADRMGMDPARLNKVERGQARPMPVDRTLKAAGLP